MSGGDRDGDEPRGRDCGAGEDCGAELGVVSNVAPVHWSILRMGLPALRGRSTSWSRRCRRMGSRF